MDTPPAKTVLEMETNVQSLSELFSKDPLAYTDQDIVKIVEVLRESRLKFISADAVASKTSSRVKAPKPISVKKLLAAAPEQLNIDDLLAGL